MPTASSRTIEAVLWDFGGVFTTSPFEAFNRFEAGRGLPENFIRTVNSANPHGNAWARFESSEIAVDEFDKRDFCQLRSAAGAPALVAMRSARQRYAGLPYV